MSLFVNPNRLLYPQWQTTSISCTRENATKATTCTVQAESSCALHYLLLHPLYTTMPVFVNHLAAIHFFRNDALLLLCSYQGELDTGWVTTTMRLKTFDAPTVFVLSLLSAYTHTHTHTKDNTCSQPCVYHDLVIGRFLCVPFNVLMAATAL